MIQNVLECLKWSKIFQNFLEHSRLFILNQGQEVPRHSPPKRLVIIHFGGGGQKRVERERDRSFIKNCDIVSNNPQLTLSIILYCDYPRINRCITQNLRSAEQGLFFMLLKQGRRANDYLQALCLASFRKELFFAQFQLPMVLLFAPSDLIMHLHFPVLKN